MTNLKFNPDLLTLPVYGGGLTGRDVRSRSAAAKLYKLSSNENPLGSSPAVAETIRRFAGTLGEYSPVTDARLRDALAGAYGRNLSAGNFFTANGGFEVLDMIARGFLSPGDNCIICRPTFGVYAKTAMMQGANVVDIPLEGEHFAHDVEAILARIDATTRVIYICNPNNPSGAIMSSAQMDRLVAGIPDHVVIVADEVYHHFVSRKDFPDSIGHVLDDQNVIIVRSFSKAYGLAGLRVGYAIGRPEIVDYLARLQRTFHLNTLALEGAITALEHQEHVEKTIRHVWREKEWLYEQLAWLKVKVWPSQANFLLMQCPVPAQELFEYLLDAGIIVRPADMFGLPDCLRVTIGLREANEALVGALSRRLRSTSSEKVKVQEQGE
jgi:histidinol-phosphate aminotransferase